MCQTNIDLRIGFRLGIHALLGKLLDFRSHNFRRIRFAARDAAKVFLRHRRNGIRFEVAHEDQGDVLRRIIKGVKLVRLDPW